MMEVNAHMWWQERFGELSISAQLSVTGKSTVGGSCSRMGCHYNILFYCQLISVLSFCRNPFMITEILFPGSAWIVSPEWLKASSRQKRFIGKLYCIPH